MVSKVYLTYIFQDQVCPERGASFVLVGKPLDFTSVDSLTRSLHETHEGKHQALRLAFDGIGWAPVDAQLLEQLRKQAVVKLAASPGKGRHAPSCHSHGGPSVCAQCVRIPSDHPGALELLSYNSSMKGAIGTQLGAVRFANMTLVDNGGGPRAHEVSGKDNGAAWELTWIVDDRNRAKTNLYDMAGLYDSLLVSKTKEGNVGTAGRWPSSRKITGVITHSPAEFHVKHTALGALVNVTFVNYSSSAPVAPQFRAAIESCGKCKTFQGGATTFTKQLTWLQQGLPALSEWSWGHQGMFQDLDGTLLNNATLPADLVAAAPFPVGVPNTTWHSGVDSRLFDPAECVYVTGRPTSNNGVFCSSALSFRRVMLHDHQPNAITFRPLLVTSAGGAATNTSRYNGTSTVYFQHYNEDGYQFTVPTGRDYYLHWDIAYRVDPTTLALHKPDPYDPTGWVTLTQRSLQVRESFSVNGVIGSLKAVPSGPNVTDGAMFYNKTLAPDPWWYGNYTYNSTAVTTYIAGPVRHARRYQVDYQLCPPGGCNSLPDGQIDNRAGILLWSDNATWVARPGGKPKPGENVTIPQGWNLVIDESPDVNTLIIQGSVTFDPTKPITLTATYILVLGPAGILAAGNASAPYPGRVTIQLRGSRQTTDWAVANDLNLGAKVLAALRGGRIELWGKPVGPRWTRLAAAAPAGATSITLAQPVSGWPVGGQLFITSTSWNPWQAEQRTIVSVSPDGRTLGLDTPLSWPHSAKVMDIPGAAGGAFDMRAEVGLLSSNIAITAVDGPVQKAPGGEMFGCRVIAHGASLLRLSHTQLDYCGQAGLLRAALMMDRLSALDPNLFNITTSLGPTATSVPNPSFVSGCTFTNNMDAALDVETAPGNGVRVVGNVLYGSFDRHTLMVSGSGNTISANLALGTIKDMSGKSSQDKDVPATYFFDSSDNIVTHNVAAGSERVGFTYKGIPCTKDVALLARYANNSAHSNLVGAWLKSSPESDATGCTALFNFTTYLNWDFGIISTDGITTDVELTGVNIADSKFANLLVLRKGGMTDKGQVTTTNTTLVGMSGSDVCGLCNRRVDGTDMDPGCHPKLARQSYNQISPFTPVKGVLGSVFALKFTPGPEPYPWDGLKGYAIIYGVTYMRGTTLAHFYGSQGCEGKYQTYALGNHVKEPEAFHPVFMTKTNTYNIASDGLTKFLGPDPLWRDESMCDTINWSRAKQQLVDNDSIAASIADTSVVQLTCAGPSHVNFRDVDGSLTGKPSSLIGHYANNTRSIPFDLGTAVIPGPCQYSPVMQSYQCVANSSNYELDPKNKPSPIPAAGIFGDPQHFVLESRDPDSEDRNFSPVFFNVSGVVELATPGMSHTICFAYKCQKRISTFWTYLPSGHTVNVTFTGTPSRVFRLHWPYADPSAEVILVINYQSTPNRRFAWTPTYGRLNPLTAPPSVGDGSSHGAFYWDQDATLLYIKLVGASEALEVRTENALMVSQSLAVSFDQFFDVRDMFLSNLAFLLGIPVSRIQIASIVPGSINLKYMIYDSPAASSAPIAEPVYDTSNNVDPDTRAYINSLPPSQQAAFIAQMATDNAASTSPPPPASAPPPPGASDPTQPSLVTVVKSFVNLPTTIGNLQVLSSGIDTNGAVMDPALLAAVKQAAGIPADNSGTYHVPPPTNAPAPAPSEGDSKSNKAVIGGVVGGVVGSALLVAGVAAYVVHQKKMAAAAAVAAAGGAAAGAAGAGGTAVLHPGNKVSPLPSAHPSQAGYGPTNMGAKANQVAPEPGTDGGFFKPALSPLNPVPLNNSAYGGVDSPRAGAGGQYIGTAMEQGYGSPIRGVAPTTDGGMPSPSRVPLLQSVSPPRIPVPPNWDSAAVGRPSLPTLPDGPQRASAAGVRTNPGYNVMVASDSTNGAITMHNAAQQARLPGAPSFGANQEGAAQAAAHNAVNQADQHWR